MKPLTLTNVAGQAVHISPMAIIGWVSAEVPVGNGKVIMGTAVALPDGARQVRESPEQVAFLFERATDGWLQPKLTRADLEAWVDTTRLRESGGGLDTPRGLGEP